MDRQFLVAVFLAVAIPCSADELIAKPEIRPGDRWVYNRMEYWTNTLEFVYEIETTFANDRVIATTLKHLKDNRNLSNVAMNESRQVADTVWTAEWNAMSDIEGAVISPHTGLLKFPLAVGDRYQSNYTVKVERNIGFSVKHERAIKIVGWENIVVPAGQFRALRIEAEGWGQNLITGKSGVARNIIWYAPAVKRWVKSVYESAEYNLPTSYTRGAGQIPTYKNGDELVEYRPGVQ